MRRKARPKSYGLRAGVLGPVETLAQSVSAMAPSTSPSLTIPLVFALAGNATWFVYLLATGAMLLVGFCVSRFARLSASPGSLYTYTANTLPPAFGVTAAWGLLLAYLATGASVAGGALYYADRALRSSSSIGTPPAVAHACVVVCAVAGCIAYRDVKLSAEVMLWIEAVSVSLILIVLVLLPVHFGLHFDLDQFRLKGALFPRLGPALVLAIFSFVGFESATTLGGEAREPLKTIPRAVLQCALLAGVFFMLCAYSEVLGFRGESSAQRLHQPLCICSPPRPASRRWAWPSTAARAVSMFACVLACTTAAARVLMRMAHGGLLPAALERTNRRHGTPGAAIALSAGLMFAATAALALRGATGQPCTTCWDRFRSSVFSPPTRWWRWRFPLRGARSASILTWLRPSAFSPSPSIVLIAIFDLNSATDAIHARIPYIYLGYIAAG